MKLEKDMKFNLTKETDKLNIVKAVLGWNTPENVYPAYDLDVSCFLLDDNSKLLDELGFIFYNNEKSVDGSVQKSPDELSGGTEELIINIGKLSPTIKEISIIVTIHKAKERNQNFGKVKDSYIDLYNHETNEKIASFQLDRIAPENTAIQVGSFFNTPDGFIFQPVGAGSIGTLGDFLEAYK
ncbi:MAG: TerD family protein [Flavobacterium sp.]|uniref:TerD family protein n=1 Tax=Flavobacterium sp. TaxID=239 RepID=UPI002606D6ED|nr:TerD family protein [Flavobacterium sp.]MDD5150155.1 TerD family protein [Flavobacterium sp.]